MIKIRFRRTQSASELSGKKGECVVLQHEHAEQGQVVAISELHQVIRLLVPLEGSMAEARKLAVRKESGTASSPA